MESPAEMWRWSGSAGGSHYVELPELFPLDDRAERRKEIKWYRFVGVSAGRLRFVDILATSYKAKQMPEEAPVLTFVHPHISDVVYFFLKRECFFSVDVRNSDVVAFVRGNHGTLSVNYWHHCLPWVLPPWRPSGMFCLACSVL
jgi:hypothetical protein